ncbi:hypothetical protein [Leptospira noguchii]|nr:hypothetical protein [Leptospira noguchii]EKR74379.1 hypothetical protein LEP1GSC041_1940 [Leptospira noguchii str. 2006001870]UOG47535.1 hypothetical protein MAL00_10640 [Leptospira noguchii]
MLLNETKSQKVIKINYSSEFVSLPQISEDILMQYKNDYEKLIYKLNSSFKFNSSWWFVPVSSREWYSSEIQRMYQFYPKMLEFLKKQSEQITLSCNTRFQKDLVEIAAKKNGYKVICPFRIKMRFKIFAILDVIRIKKIFLSTIFNFLRISIKSFFRSNLENDGRRLAVFFRPIHEPAISIRQDTPWDHYFGELPYEVSKTGRKVIILGLSDNPCQTTAYYNYKDDILVYSIFHYWSYKDFFRIFFFGLKDLFFPPQVTADIKSLLPGIADQINKEVRYYYWNRLIAKAFELTCKRFFSHNSSIYLFHTYENNWWERAVDMACKENYSKVKANYGFLHCAILESHKKYVLINDEWSLKPSPDKIIVTGPKAKEILLGMGKYDLNGIEIGYDLRGPNLNNIKRKSKKPEQINRILVLLEGLNTMPGLLILVMESLRDVSSILLTVRCHPVYPISNPDFDLVRKNSCFDRISVSNGTSLDEDLLISDAVIYKGSTSALYAAYMGIPLLRFKDDGWWASDDPLLYCGALKKEFGNSLSLIEGINYFKSLSEEEYLTQSEEIRVFALEYMRPYKKGDLGKYVEDLFSEVKNK